MKSSTEPRIGLVLGGGALKGFAHIGALQALEESDIRPSLVAGTSIGALMAAAWAGGMPTRDMANLALGMRRKDLFRINHMGMLMDRMRSQSIYMSTPLKDIVETAVRSGDFESFPVQLLVTGVDLERGTGIVWGTPGLKNVPVRDAVYASCALPGFFPPGKVGERWCVDGGTTDNLPVAIAAVDCDVVLAVDVGIAEIPEASGISGQGFASVYMRAATIMMRTLQTRALNNWNGPPVLLVRPPVSHISWFDFRQTEALIQAGYDSMQKALESLPEVMSSDRGVFPKSLVQLSVDQSKCTGCGICVARAPDIMGLNPIGIAFPKQSLMQWSPADGAFLNECPTNAIRIHSD